MKTTAIQRCRSVLTDRLISASEKRKINCFKANSEIDLMTILIIQNVMIMTLTVKTHRGYKSMIRQLLAIDKVQISIINMTAQQT